MTGGYVPIVENVPPTVSGNGTIAGQTHFTRRSAPSGGVPFSVNGVVVISLAQWIRRILRGRFKGPTLTPAHMNQEMHEGDDIKPFTAPGFTLSGGFGGDMVQLWVSIPSTPEESPSVWVTVV